MMTLNNQTRTRLRPAGRAGVHTIAAVLLVLARSLGAQESPAPPLTLRDRYAKHEYRIPMRDGAKLFTAVYTPKDTAKPNPILLRRTPYSVDPYGEDQFPGQLGPSEILDHEGYIFVMQDVRGCYMSEGAFTNMTPHLAAKKSPADVDESSDTYDTIAWLLQNVSNHNGRVGQWGISYPGFYSSAGMIDAHPALIAVSPQAPVADWYFDDFRHHGAFFLPHAFNFISGFGKPRPELTRHRPWGFDFPTQDGYRFYLELGPLRNVNERHLKDENPMWNEVVEHVNYDAYWQSRNILPHLKNVAPAVMTVGGWFDAEDLYGTLKTYYAIERQNPGIFNALVMGPWDHGGWGRRDGDRLGNIHFGQPTSKLYREQIESVFFRHYLKGEGAMPLPEAYMFETGANRWRMFDAWPPKESQPRTLVFHEGGRLSFEPLGPRESVVARSDPTLASSLAEPCDEFVSDPSRPVPYTETVTTQMTREYMTDDQRFASTRPDVLTYQTSVLEDDLTLAGPILADLWVSTTGTDADWIVKVIDVFPPTARAPEGFHPQRPWDGYQMMVRSEVIRGRFRNSYERPEPFVPNQSTRVKLELQDVLHTFRKDHRLMIQIHSTWFPLVDRNPQRFVPNVFHAEEKDFVKATHRVFRSPEHSTCLKFGVIPALSDPPAPPG